MRRFAKDHLISLFVVALAVALACVGMAYAASNSVTYGGGQGDSTFVFNDTTKQLTVTSVITAPPTTQVIAATNTIAADACGGLKRISSAAPVTTNTTNTFTAPAAANTGCFMSVCNVNASDAITLDNNGNFESAGAADVALAGKECVTVESDGSIWRQVSAKQANHA